MLEHIELTTGYIERYSFGMCFSNNISMMLVGLVQSLVCYGPGVVYTTPFYAESATYVNIKSHLSSFCVRMSPCQTFCCLLDFFVLLLLVSILDPSVLLYGVNRR